jgi:hypothetical protein
MGWNYTPGVGYSPPSAGQAAQRPAMPAHGGGGGGMPFTGGGTGMQAPGLQYGVPSFPGAPPGPPTQRIPEMPATRPDFQKGQGMPSAESTENRGFGSVYNKNTVEIFNTIRNMPAADRQSYLQRMRDSLSQRMQRYAELQSRGFGGEMDETAKRDYESIVASLKDIDRMLNDPSFWMELTNLAGAGMMQKQDVKYT